LSAVPLRALLAGAALGLALAGCSQRTVTLTPRSGVEQELVVRALERAIAGIDVTRLERRRVTLELTGLTGDEAFARNFLTALLQARGVDVVPGAERPDLRLKVFATVLGTDHGETLIGVPALQVPLLPVPIPEIALFKWARHRGVAEIQTFIFDGETGLFLSRIPDGVGRAKFDRFTVLLVVSFVVDDLGDRPPAPPP
jgi:hypothetical protein